MAIRIVFPNGHALKVDESSAGKSGVCPVCKAPVRVPPKKPVAISEDSLMDFLEPKDEDPLHGPKEWSDSDIARRAAAERSSPPMKTCVKCNRQMDLEARICPHCHTYVGGARRR